MALISNGTTIASGGSLSVSTTPTTSQVLSATASASVGSVGTYAMLKNSSHSSYTEGTTVSTSNNLSFGSNSDGYNRGDNNNVWVSGTWRVMGSVRDTNNNNQGKTSVWLRIS